MTENPATRPLRPVACALIAAVLIAVGVWQTGVFKSPTAQSENSRITAASTSDQGLVIYQRNPRSTAPNLEGTTLDGDPFALSDLAGKIVVINVSGSWCGPCRAETPDLVRLARHNANRGVRFVGIDTRDNLASAKAFVTKFKVPYPSLFDEGGQVLLPFRGVIPTAVIPSSVVIDREGKVAARVIGPVTHNTLNSVLNDELAGGTK